MRAIYKPCVRGYWFSVDLLRSSAGHQHSPCNTVIPSKFIGLATFFKSPFCYNSQRLPQMNSTDAN